VRRTRADARRAAPRRQRERGARRAARRRGVEAADAERDGREHHRAPRHGLERALGAERPGERRPRGVPQLALGQRHANGVAAARREDAAEPRAADVPRARAPARDSGHVAASTPRHATPRETCPHTWRTTASTSHPIWARRERTRRQR
jgi:hypothetical protein